jgi:hypothetical protein
MDIEEHTIAVICEQSEAPGGKVSLLMRLTNWLCAAGAGSCQVMQAQTGVLSDLTPISAA